MEKAIDAEQITFTVHDLKVYPKFWEALRNKSKTFEVRKNDRKFKVGDKLRLRRFDPGFGFSADIPEVRTISYILHHEDMPVGVPAGYVVLGFRP